MPDPVLMHAQHAVDAAKEYGVPASVILAVLSVEGGTDANGRPVVPGDGLGPASYGQFITSTGKQLGIVYGDSRSETFGVARYLQQLGYGKDPTNAIGAYNGGPANPQMGYAAKVLEAAKRYVGFDDGTAAAPTSTTPAATGTTSTSSDRTGTLARVGLTAALVLVGVTLLVVGVARATGLQGKTRQIANAHPIAGPIVKAGQS